MQQIAAIETRTLYWSCTDESNLIAAVVRQSLDLWQAQNQTHHQRVFTDHTSDAQQLGLAVWAVTAQAQLAVVCGAIDNQRRGYPSIFQLVFLASDLASYQNLMIEAGATIVVHQIWDLQTVLLTTVNRLFVSLEGHHPLTRGLIHRLPWK